MSIVKKSDVKNHLSLRYRTQIHLCRPDSQPDATGYSAAESSAVQSNPSIFTEDFVGEHSSSGKSVAPISGANDSPAPPTAATLKSAQA